MPMLAKSALLSLTFMSALANAQNAPDPFSRDLVLMSKWFEGSFDNDSQRWFEEDRRWQGEQKDKHRRNHAKHLRITNSSIGEHVFYVEEYADDDPDQVWRQRIVSLQSEPARGIQMKLFFIKDAKAFIGKDAKQVAAMVDERNLTNVPSCDVWFRREGEQFEGQMDGQKCVLGEGEKRRYSQHDIVLSENQYWRIDKTWLFSNGKMYQGETSNEPIKMRRASMYECKVSMPFISYAEPHKNDVSLSGLIVHNQGGTAKFTDPKTNKEFELQLREKQYPYYKEGSDFFLMRLKEVSAKYSAALVTTAPNPDKLSVNVGNMAASCKRV